MWLKSRAVQDNIKFGYRANLTLLMHLVLPFHFGVCHRFEFLYDGQLISAVQVVADIVVINFCLAHGYLFLLSAIKDSNLRASSSLDGNCFR